MLFNPEWEAKTRPDPLTLESLIAWLEKQPTDKEYNYGEIGGACLIGQHLTAHGVDWREYGSFETATIRMCVAGTGRKTFGAALARAKALLAVRS